MKWKPIETAPKDTLILGWVPSYYQGIGGHDLIIWYQNVWRSNHAFRVDPTHWMPLPKGPNAKV